MGPRFGSQNSVEVWVFGEAFSCLLLEDLGSWKSTGHPCESQQPLAMSLASRGQRDRRGMSGIWWCFDWGRDKIKREL